MPEFEATVRVVYLESWSVEAADEHEARKKIIDLDSTVILDDGGEVIDWEIAAFKQVLTP